jgi:hypothetical protein
MLTFIAYEVRKPSKHQAAFQVSFGSMAETAFLPCHANMVASIPAKVKFRKEK